MSLKRRVSQLEPARGLEPTHEEWVDILDAEDQDAAIAALEWKYPAAVAAYFNEKRHKPA